MANTLPPDTDPEDDRVHDPRYYHSDLRPRSYWTVSFGGAPRWLLFVSGLVLIASGIVILIGTAGR